jgi:hypothetical protein
MSASRSRRFAARTLSCLATNDASLSNMRANLQPSLGPSKPRRLPALVFLVLTIGLPSCSEDGERSLDAETDALDGACLWETNELLSQVDAPTAELTDCGIFLGDEPLDNACFTDGLEAGRPVQITINNCIDCMIHSTYVSTADAAEFHLYREADHYGDNVREVRIDSCTGFVAGEGPGANCAGAAMLYTCSDPLRAPSAL